MSEAEIDHADNRSIELVQPFAEDVFSDNGSSAVLNRTAI